MNQGTDFIHQAFAIFLFSVAITILLITYRSYIQTLTKTKNVQNENIMFVQYSKFNEIIITKGEIITMLFNQPEYDVEIDGTLISKMVNIKENMTSYTFDHVNYKKSYSYDNYGNITRIIFQGI